MCHIAYFVVALVSRFVSYRDASSLSQFPSDLVRGVHARARREKRGRASPVSRPRALRYVHGHLPVSRVLLDRPRKKRLLVAHIISTSFESLSLNLTYLGFLFSHRCCYF